MTPTLTAFPPGWPRAARLGIHHKFVRALADQPDARIYRKSGTGKDFRADSALVEQGGLRYVMVAIAEHPGGGEWLVRLGPAMHRLIVGSAGSTTNVSKLAVLRGRIMR